MINHNMSGILVVFLGCSLIVQGADTVYEFKTCLSDAAAVYIEPSEQTPCPTSSVISVQLVRTGYHPNVGCDFNGSADCVKNVKMVNNTLYNLIQSTCQGQSVCTSRIRVEPITVICSESAGHSKYLLISYNCMSTATTTTSTTTTTAATTPETATSAAIYHNSESQSSNTATVSVDKSITSTDVNVMTSDPAFHGVPNTDNSLSTNPMSSSLGVYIGVPIAVILVVAVIIISVLVIRRKKTLTNSKVPQQDKTGHTSEIQSNELSEIISSNNTHTAKGHAHDNYLYDAVIGVAPSLVHTEEQIEPYGEWAASSPTQNNVSINIANNYSIDPIDQNDADDNNSGYALSKRLGHLCDSNVQSDSDIRVIYSMPMKKKDLPIVNNVDMDEDGSDDIIVVDNQLYGEQ